MSEPRSRSVVDEAIFLLKKHIELGEFAPGSRLPTEPVLAEQLGVSRLSLREAVRALVVVGVLETRHGSGVYVTELRPDKIVQIMGGFLELSHDSHLAELFECRRILEAGATAQAATRISDERLARLQTRIKTMEELDDAEQQIVEDLAFHREIVEAAGNPTLASFANIVAQRTARARVWSGVVDADARKVAADQHRAIHAALMARDSHAAYAAATVHVVTVERRLRERLQFGTDAADVENP
jgi:GntR family transcriptional repressor for pyruvate dehydrogenase complex